VRLEFFFANRTRNLWIAFFVLTVSATMGKKLLLLYENPFNVEVLEKTCPVQPEEFHLSAKVEPSILERIAVGARAIFKFMAGMQAESETCVWHTRPSKPCFCFIRGRRRSFGRPTERQT
jgi:hypothetical protein